MVTEGRGSAVVQRIHRDETGFPPGDACRPTLFFGLPVYLSAARFTRANLAVRGLAGLFSLSFGLFTVYEVGFVHGLFRRTRRG